MIRGRKEQYECKTCKGMFTARTADRARGWAQYCSKACKQIWQEEGRKIWQILKSKTL